MQAHRTTLRGFVKDANIKAPNKMHLTDLIRSIDERMTLFKVRLVWVSGRRGSGDPSLLFPDAFVPFTSGNPTRRMSSNCGPISSFLFFLPLLISHTIQDAEKEKMKSSSKFNISPIRVNNVYDALIFANHDDDNDENIDRDHQVNARSKNTSYKKR